MSEMDTGSLSGAIDTSAGFDTPAAGDTGGDAEPKAPKQSDDPTTPALSKPDKTPEPKAKTESKATNEGEGQEAKPAGEPKPKEEASTERFTVKADGKEYELSRDEVVRRASMGIGAERRFQEAAQMRKDIQTVVDGLKDPNTKRDMLMRLGIDLQQEVEQEIQERIRLAKMTEEERQRHHLDKREEQLRAQEEQWRRQQHEAYVQRQTQVAKQQYQVAFSQALEQVGLPASEYQIARMATVLKSMTGAGHPMSHELVQYAAQLVRDEYNQEFQSVARTPEGLLDRLSEEERKALRKHFTEEAKKKAQSKATESRNDGEGQTPRKRRKDDDELTTEDVWAELQGNPGNF